MKRILESKELQDMRWCESRDQLADGLTKKGVLMNNLLDVAGKGHLTGSKI